MNGAESVTATAKELADALGITRQALDRQAKNWPVEITNGRGDRKFILRGLPPDVQKAYVAKHGAAPSLLPVLAPEAALEAAKKLAGLSLTPALSQNGRGGNGGGGNLYNIDTASWSPAATLGQAVLQDPRVTKCITIVQDAMNIPKGWKKGTWYEHVAEMHNIPKCAARQQISRYVQTYREKGIAGFHHIKGNREKPRSWSPEAVEFWLGLCMRSEHRKLAHDGKKELYRSLQVEAQERGWAIGSYESAIWWYKKRGTPQLTRLQRGGRRALDNLLPPVVRSYADLAPFEILVGDQHRFDYWVTDEVTGEVFRPEGYFWQDLRTRAFYGFALAKKYDAHLMGLAARMGCYIFGPFKQIYTDNGKPETAQYIMSILREMRTLGMEACFTIDAEAAACEDGETVNPCVLLPGVHRKAIVRNAKAKMIESTNRFMEGILRSVFKVPGYAKVLGAGQEENEVDQAEIKRLALSGELLTFREFYQTVLKAMDYYNSQKPHRGVLKEWAWTPKPSSVTPMDCLKACYLEGWRAFPLSREAIDLVFLARAGRDHVVKQGRITFQNELYEDTREWTPQITHLVNLHGERVEIRFDPIDPDWILVFHGNKFICRAVRVEYSSMKDGALAKRKIEEKRRMCKAIVEYYERLTSAVPNVLAYSQVPAAEKAAAIVGAEKRKQLKEKHERTRERTDEELAAEVARIEEYAPDKPLFSNQTERYTWCISEIGEGRVLDEADGRFVKEHEAQMNDETREYWNIYKESLGLKEAAL